MQDYGAGNKNFKKLFSMIYGYKTVSLQKTSRKLQDETDE
jgi:hypothetical protein